MKFRHEYKVPINLSDILQLRPRLAAIMRRDEHCEKDGTYIVKSLYFDNYFDKALREKTDGVNCREKFRIRYYGTDTSFMRLEKKSKINGLCNKVSSPISARECEMLLNGNTHFLIESENMLFRELYAKMRYQLLRPKCIVSYTRESFVYPAGNVRVTIDSNIGGSYDVGRFLDPSLGYLQLYREAVLEVKWDDYIPQLIREAVQLKTRRSGAFSKYAAVRF